MAVCLFQLSAMIFKRYIQTISFLVYPSQKEDRPEKYLDTKIDDLVMFPSSHVLENNF